MKKPADQQTQKPLKGKPAPDKHERLTVSVRQQNRPRRYVPSGRKGKR